MHVSALAVDPITGVPMVILTDELGGSVPVGIGLGEASAIAAELDDIVLERPMTHQLLAELIAAAGARIARIELRDTGATTFTAAITIECSLGNSIERPARPSDAFALALRVGREVWVSVSVLARIAGAPDASDMVDDTDDHHAVDQFDMAGTSPDALHLDKLGPEAFGKWKM